MLVRGEPPTALSSILDGLLSERQRNGKHTSNYTLEVPPLRLSSLVAFAKLMGFNNTLISSSPYARIETMRLLWASYPSWSLRDLNMERTRLSGGGFPRLRGPGFNRPFGWTGTGTSFLFLALDDGG